MSSRALAGAAAVVGLLALLQAGAIAQSPDSVTADPAIPPPVGFVNDRAGVMDEPSRARLEAFLDQVKQKTGAEFAVLTVRSTEPLTPSEYKVRVFESWGLGKKGRDDGLLMLVVLDAREVRFETGYGLEGALPDGFQSRVVREDIAPRFRAGDFAGGIVAGVLRCAARIAAETGATLEWNGRELRYSGGQRRRLPSAVLIFLLFAIFVIVLSGMAGGGRRRRRRRGLMGPWYDGWGGGGFGGGIGGGGFGGGWGGGGFGGGGGGSFGGFGGGSSGGGGGGGKW